MSSHSSSFPSLPPLPFEDYPKSPSITTPIYFNFDAPNDGSQGIQDPLKIQQGLGLIENKDGWGGWTSSKIEGSTQILTMLLTKEKNIGYATKSNKEVVICWSGGKFIVFTIDPEGHFHSVILGPNVTEGEFIHVIVPANHWKCFALLAGDSYALMTQISSSNAQLEYASETQIKSDIPEIWDKISKYISPDRLGIDTGILFITIISCQSLEAVDTGGSSDPYCLLYHNSTLVYRTKTHKKSLSPIFNEDTSITIPSVLSSNLKIEVMDYNALSKDVLLGVVHLDLSKHIHNEQGRQFYSKTQEMELSLEQARSGTIKIRLSFQPTTTLLNPKLNEQDLDIKTVGSPSSMTSTSNSLNNNNSNNGSTTNTTSIVGSTLSRVKKVITGSLGSGLNIPESISELSKSKQSLTSDSNNSNGKPDHDQGTGRSSTSDGGEHINNNNNLSSPMGKSTISQSNTKHELNAYIDEDNGIETIKVHQVVDVAWGPVNKKTENNTTSPSYNAQEPEANDFDHLLLAVESKNANQTKAIEVATGAGYCGDLTITIHSAHNLKPVDRGGTSDPFIRILRNSKLIHKTKHVLKTLSPIWDKESISFKILPVDTSQTTKCIFQVMDWNAILDNISLGECELDVIEELRKLGVPSSALSSNENTSNSAMIMNPSMKPSKYSLDMKLPVRNGTGELHIQVEFVCQENRKSIGND